MADEPSDAPASTQESPEPKAASGRGFSQEDVDRIVRERLERQKQQFADYSEVKAKAAKLDELEESRKTEAEKLLGAVDKYKSEAQAALEREKQALERANSMLVRSAVVSEAAKQNAVDPDDVFGLLDKAKVTISDDGKVTGAADAVKELLQSKPHLVGRSTGDFGGGAQGQPAGGPSMNDLIRLGAGFGHRS